MKELFVASLLEALRKKKILVSDGAWGTFLQHRGLQAGECPELWNVTHPDDVFAIAKSYIDAGSAVILTNSFGGHPQKLKHYGLQERARELNIAAAAISRRAAGADKLVMGSMGPSGVMLMMGEVSQEELYDGFALQAQALKEGGVDAICIETMSDLEEATIAVRAAKETTGLETVCTFTFDKTPQGFRSMMGVSPSMIVDVLKNAGADVIGTNCGNGIVNMIEIVKELRQCDSSIPILVHANAGLPEIVEGKTVFPETPEFMASYIQQLIDAGASIVGGCCGTTPLHIQFIVTTIKKAGLR